MEFGIGMIVGALIASIVNRWNILDFHYKEKWELEREEEIHNEQIK